jgi:hypothetical protein
MSRKHKPRSRPQPTRQGNGSASTRKKAGSDTTKPWYTRISTWLAITVATGIIGGAAGVIGSQLGNAVTAPGEPNGPPVLVSQVFFGPGDDGLSYALPSVHHLTPAELTNLATSGHTTNKESFDSFIQKNQGAAADGTAEAVVQLTLRGNRTYPVLVTGMQVTKQCGKPMRGTLFYSPAAAQSANAMIGFDLDKSIPQADAVSSSGKLGISYFLQQQISLISPQDTQGVSVEATTMGSCAFRLVLQVLDGSTTTYETVGNSTTIGTGPPFRITRMLGNAAGPDVADYGLVYVGGVMDSQCDDAWTSVNYTFSPAQSTSVACNQT